MYYLLSLLRHPAPFFLFLSRPRTRDLMNFCHQFAVMLGAGITVMSALEILEWHSENPLLKKTIKKVGQRVEKGKSLTEAVAEEEKIFPPFFKGMVEAGETGGELDKAMQQLALHFERKSDLEQKIKTATAYPIFVFLIIIVVVAFLLVFVIPTFAGTFTGMGVDPPLPTRLLITAGKGLRVYWYLVIAGGVAIYLLFRRLLKTKKGGYYRDRLLFRLPLFGRIYHKMMVARFCRALSSLLGSGVGLLTALDLAKNVVDNNAFRKRINLVKEDIIRGEAIAGTLSAAGFFPFLVIGMVDVGEQSGKMEEMFARAADLYESEVNYVIDRLSSLVEPVLIIFLSLVVGGIVLSVFLPLFNIFDLYLLPAATPSLKII